MIEIGEMKVSVPGIDAGEAKQMAESIAGRMVELMPGAINSDKQIRELNVKINYSSGVSNEQLANDIAKQVMQQLKFM